MKSPKGMVKRMTSNPKSLSTRTLRTRILPALLAIVLCLPLLASCTAQQSSALTSDITPSTSATPTTGSSGSSGAAVVDVSVTYDNDDLDATWDAATATTISLAGSIPTITGAGAALTTDQVIIASAGTYVLNGTLDDGQIVVNSDGIVHIVLNGVSLTCSSGSPIYVMKAKKVILTLADGTMNTLTDGTSYVLPYADSDEPDAALFSKSDLTINGMGSLIVDANYKHGIGCKDELRIVSGTIEVTAVSDGLRGRDFVAVKGGTITVDSGSDAIQSSNDEDASKGFVWIEGGTMTLSSGDDGIQAFTQVIVLGGTMTLSSGDDAIHGTVGVTIDSGTIHILQSYEGIESVDTITINGGSIDLVSSDDGINIGGAITMTGGTVVVDGPTADNNGALDYDAGFTMSGGSVVATGSSGMALAPGTTSTVHGGIAYLTATAPAGSEVLVKDASGDVVLQSTPVKSFSSIAFGSADLKKGAAYSVWVGGTRVYDFTASSIVTTLGSGGGMGGGVAEADAADRHPNAWIH